MRYLVLLLFVLGFLNSLDAHAHPHQKTEPDLCLKRFQPDQRIETYTFFWSRKTKPEWRIDPLIIHNESNQLCSSGDACFLRPLELMYVVPDSAGVTLVRYPSGPASPENISLTLEANGRYLVGTASGYDVFILDSGSHACTVGLGPRNDAYWDVNGVPKQCSFYSVETYPTGAPSPWDNYRPDMSSWVDVQECKDAGASYQPGGGGGHDPP